MHWRLSVRTSQNWVLEGSPRQLDDEYIVLENTDSSSVDPSEWELPDLAGHTYTFSTETVLEPGEQITIYTGSSTDTETELPWGQSPSARRARVHQQACQGQSR